MLSHTVIVWFCGLHVVIVWLCGLHAVIVWFQGFVGAASYYRDYVPPSRLTVPPSSHPMFSLGLTADGDTTQCSMYK